MQRKARDGSKAESVAFFEIPRGKRQLGRPEIRWKV
jgi:hypothetical protein